MWTSKSSMKSERSDFSGCSKDLHCGKESDAERMSFHSEHPVKSDMFSLVFCIVTRQTQQIQLCQQVSCQGAECLLVVEEYI